MGRREGGGAGRWMAQRVFIRTFFVRGNILGDGSVLWKVKVGEFIAKEFAFRMKAVRKSGCCRLVVGKTQNDEMQDTEEDEESSRGLWLRRS